MAVNSSMSETTWLTHFSGFIALLRLQTWFPSHPFATMIHALNIVDNVPISFSLPEVQPHNSIDVHLAVAMLRFHRLVSARNTRPLTKLETTKRRQNLRSIYKDLDILSTTSLSGIALCILVANALIDVSTTLSSQFSTTPQFTKLVHCIQCASEQLVELCEAAIPGLNLVWPLYTASIGHGLTGKRRREIRDVLRHMGEVAKVPLGLTLVRRGVSLSMICVVEEYSR